MTMVAAAADTRPLAKPHPRRTPVSVVLTLLIIVIAVVAAFPLAWMVLTSLKTPQETMQVPPVWLPATPSLDAYAKVSDVVSIGRSFFNSAVIALVTTAAIIVTSFMRWLCQLLVQMPPFFGAWSIEAT